METQLDRIEAMLETLLERTAPKKRTAPKTLAKEHDAAVALADLEERDAKWRDAWMRWCDERRRKKKYMSAAIVERALQKLEPWPIGTQIRALDDAAFGSWTDIYPQSVKQAVEYAAGEDWFNSKENGND